MPTLIINRTNEYANRWREIDIYIDGKKAGGVRNGAITQFDIATGAHIVCAKIDWAGSNNVQLTIADNEAKSLILSSGFNVSKMWRITAAISTVICILSGKFIFIIPSLFVLIYLVYKLSFGRNGYLVLSESPMLYKQ